MNTTDKNIWRQLPIQILLGGLVVFAAPAPGNARGPHYSLRDLAKSADFVGIGKVAEARREGLRVSIDEALKGPKPAEDLAIATPPISPFDGGNATYKSGDSVLVFMVNKNGKYEMSLGEQSIVVIKSAARDSYREAISLVTEYEVAASSPAKSAALKKMLHAKKPSKEAALNILALDTYAQPSDVLVKDVLALTKDADAGIASPAAQVLGQIATKEEMPDLADLAASPNKHVRQAARIALRNRTGNEVAGKDDDSDAKRKDSVRNWKAWWSKNKDKVKLRK